MVLTDYSLAKSWRSLVSNPTFLTLTSLGLPAVILAFFAGYLTYCLIFQDGGAEFVFPSDSQKKRGWGERMFSSIGTAYMAGKL